MKFNDIDLSTYGLIAKRSPVPYMPPVGIQYVQVGDKGYDFRAHLTPKIISLDVVISSATLESDLDSLSKLLNPVLGLKKLVLDKPDDRYYLAKASGGFEYQFIGDKIAVGSIQFICPDPVAFDNDEEDNDYDIDADPKTIEEATGGTGYIEPVYTLTAGEALTDVTIMLMTDGICSTEEQATHDLTAELHSGVWVKAGQRLFVPNRKISKLSFPLCKVNSPTGDVTFTIRDLAGAIINSKILGDASALQATINWEEITFDTVMPINEEVRMQAEFSGGDSANYVLCYYNDGSIKAGECLTYYISSQLDYPAFEGTYKYTYGVEELVWQGDLADEDRLVIDTARWIVKKQGIADMAGESGQFPRLKPGFTNHIKVTGFGTAGSMNVSYRNRFL